MSLKDRLRKLERQVNLIPPRPLETEKHFEIFYCRLAEDIFPEHEWCKLSREERKHIWLDHREKVEENVRNGRPTLDKHPLMSDISDKLLEVLNKRLNEVARREALSTRYK